MAQTRDWREMTSWIAQLLQERTGKDVAEWNRRVREQGFKDETSLCAWLTEQGVTGYAQSLLV